VVVTEAGIAVNPRREELTLRLKAAGLPVCTLADLHRAAGGNAAAPVAAKSDGRVVAVVEYRDGTVIDVVRVTP
jgi:citrate lyase subunit alpha/citrate CoA-transferase